MSHRQSQSPTRFVGLDVHKSSITAAVLGASADAAVIDRFFPDESSIRRFVGSLGDPQQVVACYEAGPTGYWLCRLLGGLGVRCEVIAPSLTPVRPGQRLKTDKRDARRLAELLRVGQLVPIAVPTEAEEAIRDLCRARTDVVIDRTRSRHRLSKFLLRHDLVYRDGTQWTMRHTAWLDRLDVADPALRLTLARYRSVLTCLDAELEGLERDLRGFLEEGPLAAAVARLGCYRGVTELGALQLAAEVGDWRRFARATSFMSFCGLIPSEHSSGDSVRRGSITKAGNTHLRHALVESAWSYQHRAAVGAGIRARQQRAGAETVARAWKAQVHLSAKFRRLSMKKSSRNVVVTAVARELAGFLWAEMTAPA